MPGGPGIPNSPITPGSPLAPVELKQYLLVFGQLNRTLLQKTTHMPVISVFNCLFYFFSISVTVQDSFPIFNHRIMIKTPKLPKLVAATAPINE